MGRQDLTTMSANNQSTEIRLRYGEDLDEQLADGSSDPLAWIDSFEVGGNDLFGEDGVQEYLVSFYCGILQTLPSLFEGESKIFTAANGPVYLAFEPQGNGQLRVQLCYTKKSARNPEDRIPQEPSGIADTRKFAEAVVDAAEELHNHVMEANPALMDESAYEGLRADIERGKKELERR